MDKNLQYKVTRTQQRLTTKQQRYMQLIADGYGTEDIAELLNVSDRTVEGAIAKVMRFTNARSRTHAVAICLRKKFIV